MRTLTLIALAILSLAVASQSGFAQSSQTAGDTPGPRPKPAANSSQPAYRVHVGPAESRLLYAPDPEYTEAARHNPIEGTVVLSAAVDENGVPRNIQLVKSLDPGLDQNAIAAVQKWKFKPWIKDGKPQTVPVTVELNFGLPKPQSN